MPQSGSSSRVVAREAHPPNSVRFYLSGAGQCMQDPDRWCGVVRSMNPRAPTSAQHGGGSPGEEPGGAKAGRENPPLERRGIDLVFAPRIAIAGAFPVLPST